MKQPEIAPLTTYEISRYLHVDLTTVISWCELGKLKAYKTPGGHRRVQVRDFLSFAEQYGMPVPVQLQNRAVGRTKILIVDDEESMRKVIRRVLTQVLPTAELHEAENGFEAGTMILDLLPQLVILDLMLPGIDGFKVCSTIRKDERFSKTKILAVTGQDTEANKQRILKEGADAYLAKPFEAKDLMDKVSGLLDVSAETGQ